MVKTAICGWSAHGSNRPIIKTLLVMKLTVLFLTVGFLNVSAKGVSQNVTFSGRNVSLQTAFASVEKQTGVLFMYSSSVLRAAGPVTIDAEKIPLEQFLTQIFKDQPLKFRIDGKNIFITKKLPLSDEKNIENNYFIPPFPIRGRITDVNGQPLASANIMIKGTKNGVSTRSDGNFTINGNVGDILVISSVGFGTLAIKLTSAVSAVVESLQSDLSETDKSIGIKTNNRSLSVGSSLQFGPNGIELTLFKSIAQLNEVVINKGYYSEKQRFSLGNAVHITAKDIENQPVQNPMLALQGRVPGLEVNQVSGINGGAVNVRIQGNNSIGSLPNSSVKTSTDPLIVIDGVPFPTQLIGSFWMEGVVGGGSPLNYINPSDIESIDILKDADATAIYGSRAANGAILITTKKGKGGPPKLSVNLQQGWSKVANKVDMLNTRQYLDMRYEAYKNVGVNIAMLSPNASNYDIKLWDTTRYTNWQKELIGSTAQYTNVNAAVSGGTSLLQYLIGGTYNRRTTVFPGSFDDRVASVHFNVNTTSPNQKFKIHLSASYSSDENHLPGTDLTSVAINLAPVAPALYNTDGTLNWAPSLSGASSWINPLTNSENSAFNNVTKTLVSNINLSYHILPNLEVRSNFGYTNLQSDLYTGTRLEFFRPEQRTFQQRSASFGNREMSTWLTEPQLAYTRKAGKGVIDALVGTTIQKSTQSYLAVKGSGQPNDLLLKSLSAATAISVVNSESSVFKFNGAFARLNYNWDEKYLVNLTGRRDGSNKFGDGNKFHNFGSVGLGWIFTQEKWMQQAGHFLSFGKLRASYGTTGNDQIPDFSYLSLYLVNNPGIPYQDVLGLSILGHTNPFVQWEETRKWQGGIDLGFLNDRIVLGATYARNRSSNQLTNYDEPDVTGFPSIIKNLPATVQNTSWEFVLNTVNIQRKDFNWTSSFNLTIPRNKLVKFPGIEKTPYASGDRGLIVGEPLGIIKTYTYAGVDEATGNYMVYDKDGNAVRFPNSNTDKTSLISTLPSYYGGLINSIRYKGFQLDFLFQFVAQKGTEDLYYNNGFSPNWGPGTFATGGSTAQNQPATVLNRWQKPGDQAPIGKFSTSTNNQIWAVQSDKFYSYAAGSYIRLRNLSLSWQLPIGWMQKTPLQAARIYFNGQNLATITKYNGLDPETRSIGNLPPLQTWTAGIKLDL